jgi:predicted nuclease of predicted toxin-antitoxin system
MKILFDECVPWPMQRILASHSCTTVQAEGWSGIRNSELLKRVRNDFDLLITADQNILYQQNLAGATISILELSTNDLRRIVAAATLIQRAVEEIRPGQFVRLNIPSFS